MFLHILSLIGIRALGLFQLVSRACFVFEKLIGLIGI